MKIADIVTDWIINTELFEMAYQRKAVIGRVRSLQDEIATHLIKHEYYDVSEETKSHWRSEINAWIGRIQKSKLKGNKMLSGSTYYDLLFNEPLGERSDVVGIIRVIDKIDGMGKYNKVGTVDQLHERLEKILHQLSYDISNQRIETIDYYLRR